MKRVAWLAGTRGETLLLGPAFQFFSRVQHGGEHHWFQHTGEHGTAAYQALDFLGLIPDEAAPLSHPAEEPAIRLTSMIERAESFIRARKGTHVIFSGCSPTAAGAAIYIHARNCRGLWLRPPDPAGLLPRLRWESGLERIIRACAPCVEIAQLAVMPDWLALPMLAGPGAEVLPLEEEIPGRRADAPLALIAVLRRDWGSPADVTGLLARAAAEWAKRTPKADWLVLSNLNARLEGPLRALKDRPPNLLIAPPLPYPLYRQTLTQARLILTDSALIAAEAMQRSIPLATLADFPWSESTPPAAHHRPLVPGDLLDKKWLTEIQSMLKHKPIPAAPQSESVIRDIHELIKNWLNADKH